MTATAMAAEEKKKVFDFVVIGGVHLEKDQIVPLNYLRAMQHGRGLMARKHGREATFKIFNFIPAPEAAKSLTNHDHLANVEVVSGRAPKGTKFQISTFFLAPGA